jgi:hypothetical protein
MILPVRVVGVLPLHSSRSHLSPASHATPPSEIPAPHTLGTPLPPQIWGVVQPPPREPHVMVPPQPSGHVPQFAGAGHAVSALHVGWPHETPPSVLPPPPHVSGAVHVGPHDAMTPPQPSPAGPHVIPPGHVVAGLHVGAPQTNETPPPPHVSGATQVVHVSVPPQPSAIVPHWAPASVPGHVVSGTHAGLPHSDGTPPPPQVSVAGHVPQL